MGNDSNNIIRPNYDRSYYSGIERTPPPSSQQKKLPDIRGVNQQARVILDSIPKEATPKISEKHQVKPQGEKTDPIERAELVAKGRGIISPKLPERSSLLLSSLRLPRIDNPIQPKARSAPSPLDSLSPPSRKLENISVTTAKAIITQLSGKPQCPSEANLVASYNKFVELGKEKLGKDSKQLAEMPRIFKELVLLSYQWNFESIEGQAPDEELTLNKEAFSKFLERIGGVEIPKESEKEGVILWSKDGAKKAWASGKGRNLVNETAAGKILDMFDQATCQNKPPTTSWNQLKNLWIGISEEYIEKNARRKDGSIRDIHIFTPFYALNSILTNNEIPRLLRTVSEIKNIFDHEKIHFNFDYSEKMKMVDNRAWNGESETIKPDYEKSITVEKFLKSLKLWQKPPSQTGERPTAERVEATVLEAIQKFRKKT